MTDNQSDVQELNVELSFEQWMKIGIDFGWCGPPVCYVHDGLPLSEEELDLIEAEDPCIHILRLYVDDEHKKSVEENHSPSQWRNHYTDNKSN